MIRETLPRFDLYAELEVGRDASVDLIEAAYRLLVKQHHPDVAASQDDRRIKRLNTARAWLKDPALRRRYDAARSIDRPPTHQAPARATFGIHAQHVREFLSEVRALDPYRARQVWDGRAVAHAKGYSEARQRALDAASGQRENEFLLAREAASVIARGQLGDTLLTERVLDVVADVAGAITIRDLISDRDFELLLLPWRWRGKPAPVPPPDLARPPVVAQMVAVAAAPAAAVATSPPAAARVASRLPTPRGPLTAVEPPPAAPTRSATPASVGRRATGPSIARPAMIAVIAVMAVASGIALLNAPGRDGGVVGITGAPNSTQGLGGVAVLPAGSTASSPSPSLVESAAPTATIGANGSTGPSFVPPLFPTAAPLPTPARSFAPGPTPRPTSTPAPTPKPTPTPTPSPAPTLTPAPTPTPRVMCTVPSLINIQSNAAQSHWMNAGFTGTVIFEPTVPYKIAWQSLNAGISELCTSGITVRSTP